MTSANWLNDSRQNFSILYDSSIPRLTWTRLGSVFELTEFNKAAREVLPALIVGWRDELPVRDFRGTPEVVALLWAALREDRSITRETDVSCRSRGSRTVFEITCSPLGSQRIAMHVVQLSDDQAAWARLREKEQHYRSIFENAVEGLFSSTADGRLIEMNLSHARIFGYESPAQFMAEVGHTAATWVEPKQRLELLERLATERTVRGFEYRAYKRDRSVIWLSMDAHGITDDAGHLLGLQGMEMDITPTKQGRVERDALLAQLTRAQKLKSVGELAGGIAHDFNNLLMVIAMYAEFLSCDVEEKHRAHIGQIAVAAEAGRDIVRQLVAFAREEQQEATTLDLNRVIDGIKVLLNMALRPAFTLEVDLEPDLWATRADAGQIGQVLMNLVVNARDATPEGGPIEIRTRNLRRPCSLSVRSLGMSGGDYVALSVRDHGVGMTDEVKEHLFDPFFTTKSPDEGTGLGLSIVKTIVERFGGYISVTSVPPTGTEVRVLLPRWADPD